ncbi:hypothetical protein ACWDWV_08160 [Streptosporangium sandarakinum]
MLDLEGQIHRIWNPAVRPLMEEALRCYHAGRTAALQEKREELIAPGRPYC